MPRETAVRKGDCTPDGHVSATLARRPSTAHAAAPGPSSFAYAGRFEIEDGCVFHTIEVCTDPALFGLTTMRRIALDGDSLVLEGHDFAAGSGRTQRIAWRRAPGISPPLPGALASP